jgi:hypothetical protein
MLNDNNLQQSVRSFCDITLWNNAIAVTLSLRQVIWSNGLSIDLTPERCSRNVRHFLNVLNRLVYGNATKRFGQAVSILPVIEHDETHRYHVHAAIDCPEHLTVEAFSAMIREAWYRTDWGYKYIHIDASADAGWVTYMTKRRQKTDYGLSIDWVNFHKSNC